MIRLLVVVYGRCVLDGRMSSIAHPFSVDVGIFLKQNSSYVFAFDYKIGEEK